MSDKSTIQNPPRSPPISIPPKSRKYRRNVRNSFFPEPRRTNKLIKMDLIQKAKNNKIILKKELEIYKKDLNIFTNLKNGEKLGKVLKSEENIKPKTPENIKPNPLEHKPIEHKPIEPKSLEPKPIEPKPLEHKPLEHKSLEPKPLEHNPPENSLKKKYYKQIPYSGLWLSRWWYSEGRDKTIEYLDEDFLKFMNYLDRIIDNLNTDQSGVFVLLVNNIREFINSIIPGLYNLKRTYSEYVKMVAKVDSIILTLLDFKEKTDNYLSKHKQNVRLTVKSKSRLIKTNVPEIYDNMPSNSV